MMHGLIFPLQLGYIQSLEYKIKNKKYKIKNQKYKIKNINSGAEPLHYIDPLPLVIVVFRDFNLKVVSGIGEYSGGSIGKDSDLSLYIEAD